MNTGTNNIDAETAAELQRAAALRSAIRRFTAQTEAAATESGLSSEHYHLLLMLEVAQLAGQPIMLKDLMHNETFQGAALAEFVARAERAGLVARYSPDGDSRVSVLRPTAEGHRRLIAAFRSLRASRADLAGSILELHRPSG